MSRTVSIRQSLLLNMIVVIMLLSLSIIGTTVFTSRSAVEQLSIMIIERTLSETHIELRRFFDPVVADLEISMAWGEEGMLDLDDPDRLTELFVPLLREYTNISAILLADTDGREYMLQRDQGNWFVRQMNPLQEPDTAHFARWTDSGLRTEETQTLEYDARTRPWFKGALSAAQHEDTRIHWTDPYLFFTTQEPGITASGRFEGPDGRTYVLGIDVLLRAVTDFTMSLRASEHGMTFVAMNRQLIGLPRHPAFLDASTRRSAMLRKPRELGMQIASDAATAIESGDPIFDPVRFESEGKRWWGQARLFELSPMKPLLIGVVVPEIDLLGKLVWLRVWVIGFTALALALAVLLAFLLARRYSSPIEALVEQNDRISRGDLDEPSDSVESHISEFKQLAEAQDHMRLSLRSLLKLERDLLLARQIQQSTFPKHVPTLTGFEIAAWNRPADETGGDTYDMIGFRPGARGQGAHITHADATRATLLLADATGHGVGPALSVTQVRAMVRLGVRAGVALAELIESMNRQLHADLPAGRFVTAWFGVINSEDATLTTFSAGQGPLLHYIADTDELRVLEATTLPLGVIHDLDVSGVETIAMQQGDLFAVISDGILEAMNGAGEQFGTQRVTDVLRAQREGTAQQMIDAIRAAADAFTAHGSPIDDQTMIIIKRI